MKNLNKKWLAIIIVIIILAIALGIYLGIEINSSKVSEYSPYSVVSLVNGDVYFGRLDLFPWPVLKDAYLIQKNQSGQYGLVAFSSSFFGPSNEIYLNPKEIIFWSRLKSDSPIAQAINADKNSQASQQSANYGSASSTNATLNASSTNISK